MKALITVCDMVRVAIILDLDTWEESPILCEPSFFDPTVVDRPPCHPYGITWSDTELFVANNRQLLIFDRSLGHARMASTRLQTNTHQLAYYRGNVWAASPQINSLICVPVDETVSPSVFEPLQQALRSYAPVVALDEDIYHINSLLWADGKLFVAAHNFARPSFIMQFSADSLRVETMKVDVGAAIHGLVSRDGELFWISTMTGEIRSDRGYKMSLQRAGFARGLAMTNDYFVVAISERRARMERTEGGSWIHVIDWRKKELVAERFLCDTGSINDLRLLDAFDYAHGVPPFWPSVDDAMLPGEAAAYSSPLRI